MKRAFEIVYMAVIVVALGSAALALDSSGNLYRVGWDRLDPGVLSSIRGRIIGHGAANPSPPGLLRTVTRNQISYQ